MKFIHRGCTGTPSGSSTRKSVHVKAKLAHADSASEMTYIVSEGDLNSTH